MNAHNLVKQLFMYKQVMIQNVKSIHALVITIIMSMNIIKMPLIAFLNVKMFGSLTHNNIKYVQKNHYVKM